MRRLLKYMLIGVAVFLIGFVIDDTSFHWPQPELDLNASWLNEVDPLRDQDAVTRTVWEQLDVSAGMAVADIGAGGGYFTKRFADEVGPSGAVLATEINPAMIRLLEEKKERWQTPQVQVLTSKEKTLGLPPRSVDRILVSNVYMFTSCDRPTTERFLRDARKALRPGGLLVITEQYVHLKGWRGPSGDPLQCDQERPEDVVKLAHGQLDLAFQSPVPGPVGELELPGYILVFAKRAASVGTPPVTTR